LVNVDIKNKKVSGRQLSVDRFIRRFVEKSLLLIKPLWEENSIELAIWQDNLVLKMQNLELVCSALPAKE